MSGVLCNHPGAAWAGVGRVAGERERERGKEEVSQRNSASEHVQYALLCARAAVWLRLASWGQAASDVLSPIQTCLGVPLLYRCY